MRSKPTYRLSIHRLTDPYTTTKVTYTNRLCALGWFDSLRYIYEFHGIANSLTLTRISSTGKEKVLAIY